MASENLSHKEGGQCLAGTWQVTGKFERVAEPTVLLRTGRS